MKKITKVFLKKHNACRNGYEWYLEQKTTDANKIFKRLVEHNRLNDANWVICRMFNKKQKIQYAIYAAEQVIDIFEKQYPEDKRPRQAIDAAKIVLKKNTIETRNAAAAYSAAAYSAAAYSAAAYSAAAYSAAYSANAAAAAANAAYSYANAAAANAAYAANYAAAMRIKILNYGLKLLKLKEVRK